MAAAKKKDSASDLIALALQHVEAAHPGDALKTLLEAWRATRAQEIANTIDIVDKEIRPHEPPIVAIGKTSERAAWQLAIEAERPEAYGRLLESVPFNSHAPSRIVDMSTLEADPRLTAAAREWLTTKPPLRNENRIPFYAALFSLLDRNDDARIAPLLTTMTSSESRRPSTRVVGLKNWKGLVALTAKLERTAHIHLVRETPILSAEDLATLTRIESLFANAKSGGALTPNTTDRKDLYKDVYANPDDDDARAVLSDLLQQQNDPRGELIALQLARHKTKKPRTPRERELESQWGRIWLGPIAPLLTKDNTVYERGFVARCRLAFSYQTGGTKLFPHEEFSTVTHLDVQQAQGGQELVDLVTSPVMRVLEHMTGIEGGGVELIYHANTRTRWKTLGIRGWARSSIAHLFDGPKTSFAEVRRLVIECSAADVGAEDVLTLMAKWPEVSDLTMGIPGERAADVFKSPHIKRLEYLLLKCGSIDLEFAPQAKTKKLHVIIHYFWGEIETTTSNTLRAVLANVDRNMIDRVHITTGNPRAKIVDNVLVNGSWEKFELAGVRKVAKDANVTLTLLKESKESKASKASKEK